MCCFFVSLCVKTKCKSTSTSTQCKDTSKSSNRQVSNKIISCVRQKCSALNIKLTGFSQSGSGVILQAVVKSRQARCPHCGQPSRSLHEYCYRKLQCTEVMGRKTTLILSVRRMNCTNECCSTKTFREQLSFAEPYSRITSEVASRIQAEALRQPSRLASETLARQHIQVSSSTCLRKAQALGKSNPEDIKCSGYVAIDYLAYRKGHTYMCAIADHYTRSPLAVFDSRYGPEIGEWLRKHPEIKLVSRDGSQRYAWIIRNALPNAKQVSDHFHLFKCLCDNMSEVIQKLICQTKGTLPYPYPSEDEARKYIMDQLCEMGEAKHRTKVKDFFIVRRLEEEGYSVSQIAEKMNIKSQKVYALRNAKIDKILSQEQMSVLRNMDELARVISNGAITATTICKKMENRLSLRLINRATRNLRKRYTELRKQIREHNNKKTTAKGARVKLATIRYFISTGKTESKKLLELKETHPEIENILQVCREFTSMLEGKEDAPDMDSWLSNAYNCKCPQLADH